MKILICDDDALWTERCREKLNLLAHKNNINIEIQSAASGSELLFFIDSKYADTDLIYMDIHMPEPDGMETARRLRSLNLHLDIVFYTKDISRVQEAFDVEALNYLIKGGTSEKKFEQVFLKAVARSEKRNSEYIMLSCAGEHLQIAIDKIRYFEVRNRVVTVYYQKDDSLPGTFEFYSSLAKIEENLYGKMFVRIHSSYLVGERYILQKNKKEVVLTSGETLPVGRAYVGNLKE
jgi:DNA-binding LytR/AlgR family response regulator